MRFKKVLKLFDEGNVCVFGKKGRGKDLMFGNVIYRRALPYSSNVDYGGERFELDFDVLSCGRNTYDNFITGNLKYYEFPYPDRTDVYISDAGVYLPAQYNNELNKKYPYLPNYFSLGRHVGLSNCHYNSQALGRVWLLLREQSDIYICCRRCLYIFGFVIQWIRIYDRYDSAVSQLPPLRLPKPLISNRELKLQRQIQYANYEAAHGTISAGVLFYRNKSSYDTRLFKRLLAEGVKDEKK